MTGRRRQRRLRYSGLHSLRGSGIPADVIPLDPIVRSVIQGLCTATRANSIPGMENMHMNAVHCAIRRSRGLRVKHRTRPSSPFTPAAVGAGGRRTVPPQPPISSARYVHSTDITCIQRGQSAAAGK